ncbi:hypothetical protein RCH10_001895 [Variovorax sp. GrIS 2.14]|uniref:hypothetical protein n=1 Tax=Variovorax sp. GrIS 2.14 TaxID=3071709 RepID=UPI0038F6105A
MGIDTVWVNEKHEKIQAIFDPSGCLTSLVIDQWVALPPICMRFIDPWGVTVFNQRQIPVLLIELKEVGSSSTNAELSEHLKKVIRLAQQAVDSGHTYIKFLGD